MDTHTSIVCTGWDRKCTIKVLYFQYKEVEHDGRLQEYEHYISVKYKGMKGNSGIIIFLMVFVSCFASLHTFEIGRCFTVVLIHPNLGQDNYLKTLATS